MPRMPSVPLISARPSFAVSTGGSMPASASASAAGRRLPSASQHLALADQRERGVRERREVAATRPASRARGTTGVMPALSSASIVSATTGRAPEKPERQRPRAQEHHRPHHLALDRRRPCRRRASAPARAAAPRGGRRGSACWRASRSRSRRRRRADRTRPDARRSPRWRPSRRAPRRTGPRVRPYARRPRRLPGTGRAGSVRSWSRAERIRERKTRNALVDRIH